MRLVQNFAHGLCYPAFGTFFFQLGAGRFRCGFIIENSEKGAACACHNAAQSAKIQKAAFEAGNVSAGAGKYILKHIIHAACDSPQIFLL